MNIFKKLAVANQPMGNSNIKAHPKVFTQFAGDDADHNIRAVEGSEIFHVIEIMAILTPFSGNSIIKECDSMSGGKDITFEV